MRYFVPLAFCLLMAEINYFSMKYDFEWLCRIKEHTLTSMVIAM